MSTQAIASVVQAIGETNDADEVLRATVTTLAAQSGVEWAGIGFLEAGTLTLGPEAGSPDEARRERVPIAFQGALVGELWVDGTADRGALEQIATLIAPHVLIGWDTGGEAWEP